MDIAVVLPICNERENLRPLLEEIEHALDPTGYSFEVIAVDDGSNDGSATLLRELAAVKPYLKVIFFRQNYGQSAAFDAGFRAATARWIVTMDADLQNDPADIPPMIDLLQREQLDFVAGNRGDRKDGFVLRCLPSRIANF